MCGRIEQQEYKLYANVKDSEAQRRKQEVIVSKLREDLDALKRANAKKLKVKQIIHEYFVYLQLYMSEFHNCLI